MSLLIHANLLHEIATTIDRLPSRGKIHVEGLQINLCGEDSNLGYWLQSNFGFIADAVPATATDIFSVNVICSDAWLSRIIDLTDADQFKSEVFIRSQDPFKRLLIAEHLTIDYFPGIGAAWITDRGNKCITLINSSRTPFVSIQLRLGLIDILNRYLETNRWQVIHAGSLSLYDKTFLIVGDTGVGKTSLIANLLALGATYIGDERVYLKWDGDQVLVRAFPQTVSVGLGTALQFPAVASYIQRPDRLAYIQKVFDTERVWSTPQERLAELPDQLKYLPQELTSALHSPLPAAHGKIDGILVPQLKRGQAPTALPLTSDQALDLVSRNLIAADQDIIYPRWLPLSYEFFAPIDTVALTAALSRKPIWWLHYFVENDGYDEDRAALESILQDLTD